jgi:hypothetical protein
MWYNFLVSWQSYQTIDLARLLYQENLISRENYILFLLSYL